jgi:hypothetical protein
LGVVEITITFIHIRSLNKSDFPKGMAMFFEPLYRSRNAIAQMILDLEAKKLFGSGYVQAAAWLTIRFGRVPDDITGVSHLRSDHVSQIADRNFLPCA